MKKMKRFKPNVKHFVNCPSDVRSLLLKKLLISRVNHSNHQFGNYVLNKDTKFQDLHYYSTGYFRNEIYNWVVRKRNFKKIKMYKS